MQRKSKAGPGGTGGWHAEGTQTGAQALLGEPRGHTHAQRARRPTAWDRVSLGAPSSQLQEGDRGTPSSQTTRDHGGEGLRGGPRASRLRAPVRVRQEARPTPPPNSSSAPDPSLLGRGAALVGTVHGRRTARTTPGPHGRAVHAGSALCAAVRGL